MSSLEPPSYEQIPLEVYEGELHVFAPKKNSNSQTLVRLPGTTSRPPFKFIQASTLSVKPPAWLVSGYIETDAMAALYGPPSVGKSFVALDIACCVATGKSFHGYAVQQGPVFIIVGEGHNGLARRRRAWEALHETSLKDAPLYFSSSPADLGSKDEAEWVAQAVQELADDCSQTPTLIVIDTLARNFRGEENNATDIGRFVQHVDNLLRRQWKATVLIVHHSGKNVDRGARGSSALKAAVDAEYAVSRGTNDNIICLVPQKMKDAQEPQPLTFELISVDMQDDAGGLLRGAALRLVSELQPEKPEPSGLGQNQRKALAILQQMHAEITSRLAEQGRPDYPVHILNNEWLDRCEKHGIPRKRFNEIYDSLLSRNLIHRDGPHVYLLSETSEPLGKSEIRTEPEQPQNQPPVATPPNYTGNL